MASKNLPFLSSIQCLEALKENLPQNVIIIDNSRNRMRLSLALSVFGDEK